MAEQEKETEEQEEASKETETVSEEEKEEVITFQTQAELDALIQEKATPIAQGMKDKELKPFYDDLRAEKKKVRDLERQLEDKQDVAGLALIEAKQRESWGETEDVETFQEAVRKTRQRERNVTRKEEDVQEIADNLTVTERRQSAFEKALNLFLPEDADFISKINAFADRLAEATTEKEMELLVALEEKGIKTEAEAEPRKPKRTRPDSGLPSASGEGSWESIRDAYIENPNDPKTRDAYLKARRERGV